MALYDLSCIFDALNPTVIPACINGYTNYVFLNALFLLLYFATLITVTKASSDKGNPAIDDGLLISGFAFTVLGIVLLPMYWVNINTIMLMIISMLAGIVMKFLVKYPSS